MKVHIGRDSPTGCTSSAVVTVADVHDHAPLQQQLHGREEEVCGACANAWQDALMRAKATEATDLVNQQVRKGRMTEEAEWLFDRARPKVQARVGRMFALVKRLWGIAEVSYGGLAKDATPSFMAFRLADLCPARGVLHGQVHP
jgi:IS5 family transposase